MIKKILSGCLVWLVLPAFAHEGHTHEPAATPTARPSLAVSAAFDGQGRMWRASVRAGQVLVDYSEDKAKTFSTAVAVNPQPEKVGAEGELRPNIALGRQGEIYVSWTQALDKPYAGDIKFSRSTDGGRHFSAPVVVNRNRDTITHRFDALAVANDGNIYVSWIDKRDLHAAQAAGKKYNGAAVYYAISKDNGASFTAEYKVADNSCECCRIAMTTEPDGSAVMFWRHVYGQNVRDHAIARIAPEGMAHAPVRVSYDNWQIDACPHHGPAIARGGDWGWHLAWYNGAEARQGLFYARMDDAAWVTSPPRPFGNTAAQAAHPHLLSTGERVFLVWKELTEDAAIIMLMTSDDGGRSWDAARQLAQTGGAADNPFLLSDGKHVYLSWNTARDGYRLIAVSGLEQ